MEQPTNNAPLLNTEEFLLYYYNSKTSSLGQYNKL